MIEQRDAGWRTDLSRRFNRSKYLYMLLIPGVLYFVIFHYIPIYGITIAFKDFKLGTGIIRSPWIGFEHFIRFFKSVYFFRLLRNTFLIGFYSLLFGFTAPIVLALLLNEVRNQLFKKTVQTVSYLPYFLSTVTIVGMITMILSPRTGFVNRMLAGLGIEPIYFLMKPRWFRTIYVASGIWQNVGWGSIIYLAALSRLDPELYESATIDGANRIQQIRYITIPGIRATVTILLILNVGTLLSVGFEKVFLLYNPVTYEVADVIATYVYRRGLQLADYSYGAAVGFFNSVVNLALLIIANTLARKFSEYSLW